MLPQMKRKLLDCLASGQCNKDSHQAFKKWYDIDCQQAITLSPKQRGWLMKVYAEIFEGRKKGSRKAILPTKVGQFSVEKRGEAYYVIAAGVTIPEPVSRKFGMEVIQWLHPVYESGGLEHAVIALPPPKSQHPQLINGTEKEDIPPTPADDSHFPMEDDPF